MEAQVNDLCSAWEWSESDRIYHCLPLHHIHGIVNALLCPLKSGATVEFAGGFEADDVWHRLCDHSKPGISVFMGVPSMYSQLLQQSQATDESERSRIRERASALRLWACGSAPCPATVAEQWKGLAGIVYFPLHLSSFGSFWQG